MEAVGRHRRVDLLPYWTSHDMDESRKRAFWVLFTLLALAGVALFFVPAFIIRPFRYQSPRALHLALVFRQLAPIGTILAAGAVLGLAVWAWRTALGWQRAGLAAVCLLVVGAAVMARMNYFEWMFHPVQQPGFEKAADVKLDAGEMVLTVNLNGEARAYPVREMAYHHIVNDVVGGVPIAATY
jgi:hypothetical protein